MARPKPVPPNFFSIPLFSCENSSKILSCISFEMPIPESFTRISKIEVSFLAFNNSAEMIILPFSVNFHPLEMRLAKICLIRNGSLLICTSVFGETLMMISTSLFFSAGITLLTVSRIRVLGLNEIFSISIFPASSFDKSRRSFTRRSMKAEDLLICVK